MIITRGYGTESGGGGVGVGGGEFDISLDIEDSIGIEMADDTDVVSMEITEIDDIEITMNIDATETMVEMNDSMDELTIDLNSVDVGVEII